MISIFLSRKSPTFSPLKNLTALTTSRPCLDGRVGPSAAGRSGREFETIDMLMIVDDAWREQDLRPFLQGGPNATRLITTRLSHVVPANAFRQPIDAMKGDEARELLSSGLPREQVLAQPKALSELAARRLQGRRTDHGGDARKRSQTADSQGDGGAGVVRTHQARTALEQFQLLWFPFVGPPANRGRRGGDRGQGEIAGNSDCRRK